MAAPPQAEAWAGQGGLGGAVSGQDRAETRAALIRLLAVGREKGRMPLSLPSPRELSAGPQMESRAAHLCVEAGPPCASRLVCV